MTFLEALYGSQTAEIKQAGKDGSKGRFNGTIFLTAFLIVAITGVVLMICVFTPSLRDSFAIALRNIFGYSGGKTIGKIIAAVAFVSIYFIVSRTVGREENYLRLVENFNQYPEEVRSKANKMLLVPFFVALGMVIVFGVIL